MIVFGLCVPETDAEIRQIFQERYGMATNSFTMHRYESENYLIEFEDYHRLEQALNSPPLPVVDVVFRFERWNRESMANIDTIKYKAMVELQGIPAHAYSVKTAHGSCGVLVV
jgi:hypothetical protein